MIELNPEQQRAVAQGEPVRVIDPSTRDAYVLVRAEMYERLAGATPSPLDEPEEQIPPMVLRSQQAFWRELPDLMKTRRNRGKWVAYHGDERVALARTDLEAYQECFRRGLKHEEFHIGRVETDPEGIPPWGTLEGDWSLYEFEEETPDEHS